MNGSNGALYGPELYSEMQRLICEWYGLDAADRTNSIPKLVRDLVQLQQGYSARSAQAACHDCTEAA